MFKPISPPLQAVPAISAPSKSIWASLGWLRFGLALIVAAFHLRWFYGPIVPRVDPTYALGSLNAVAAVYGFLLVSGFSICHSLVQKPQGYYKRRFLRIYPIYLVAIVFSVWVGGHWVPSGGADGGPRYFGDSGVFQVIANTFLLQGTIATPLSNNQPLWTLNLEWWLYMLAPFIVLWSARRMGILLVVLVFANLSWIALGPYLGYFTQTLWFLNIWFLGIFWVLGFWFYLNRDKPQAPWVLLAVVWFVTGLNRESLTHQYQLTLVGTCIVLIAGEKLVLPGFLARLGRNLGNASYPLYLIHFPLFTILYQFEPLRHGWLMLALTVVAAVLAHYFLEKPLRRLFILTGARLRRLPATSTAT